MHIKRHNSEMTMSSSLVCGNYLHFNHYDNNFERIGDNEYQCTSCGSVLVVKEPVLVLDDKGKLKMVVSAEVKEVQNGENPTV